MPPPLLTPKCSKSYPYGCRYCSNFGLADLPFPWFPVFCAVIVVFKMTQSHGTALSGVSSSWRDAFETGAQIWSGHLGSTTSYS
ncbi:hypothetical protein CP532_0688 [Ophiocordyceps camponoti-leonardi (nom. inval.)]|nr:hypothetical protein CP532_0688 [Ophiocordyceps camponoti-leonardi (nom. inval.)]